MEIYTFWRHFLLDEMACFVQNDAVSFTVIFLRKKTQNGVVLNDTIHLLFSLDAL